MSNLEPIEDKDLDLKSKLLGGTEKIPKSVEKPIIEKKVENLIFPEKNPERREGAAEKDAAYSKILSKIKNHAAPIHAAVDEDAKETSVKPDAETKIEKLVQLAQQKGVVHAVKVARHLDDNYVLDEFHDRLLAEELHNALVAKGLIREL